MKKPDQPPPVVISSHLRQALLAEYGLNVTGATQVKSVWRLDTAEHGSYCLKEVTHRRKRLNFVLSAMGHLANNGFTVMAGLVPTNDGRRYAKVNNHIIFLTEWVEGHKCDFANPADLAAASTSLAKFHQQAHGFVPPAHSSFRELWGKWPAIIEARWQNLLQFKQIAEAKPIKARFDQLFLDNFSYFRRQAELAVRLLHESEYDRLSAEGCQRQGFIHQDVAGRNFVITPAGEAKMIDFDLVRYDLRLLDLLRLIERTMKKCEWDIQLASLALARYQDISQIIPAEWEVLLALLVFPQKFWRGSNRYYGKVDKYSPQRLADKLEKTIANRGRRHRFLQAFAWLYCRRWLD